MCQEIHLADIRTALIDFYEEEAGSDHGQADDFLAQIDGSLDGLAHAVNHGRRAAELEFAGDAGAASIHRALVANIARERSTRDKQRTRRRRLAGRRARPR